MNYYYGNQGGGYNNGQPPNGYQPQNGYQSPYGGYQFDPNQSEKIKQKKEIARVSIATGLAVIGFTVLSFVLALLLHLMPWFTNNYGKNDAFSVCFDAIYSMIIIGVPFLCAYLFLKKRGNIKELPLGTPKNGTAFILLIFAGLMACLVGSYLSSMLGNIVEGFFGISFTMPDDGVKLTSPAIILIYVFRTALIPALIEEFSVRGVVMQSLRKYGDRFAIIMSALVFALMHGNMVQIPFAFVAGIAIGYAVIATGTMWTGVIIHFINNFISIMMQVSFDNLPQGKANIMTLAISGGVVLIGIVCALVYKFRYAHAFKLENKKSSLLSNGEKNTAFIVTVPMVIAIVSMLVETVQYIEF